MHVGGILLGTRQFVFGGVTSALEPLSFAGLLDLDTDTWQAVDLPNAPCARFATASAVLNDSHIALFGGLTGAFVLPHPR